MNFEWSSATVELKHFQTIFTLEFELEVQGIPFLLDPPDNKIHSNMNCVQY